jgi:uncharacterized membrane protein YjjB (DUF3815 family)
MERRFDLMKETILQLLASFIGSAGFALLFQIRLKLLPWASMGGALTWGVYLLLSEGLKLGPFTANLVAAAFGALLAEFSARIWKVPSTLFFLPAVVSLIPGSTLYYTMYALAANQYEDASFYAGQTGYCAMGIAIGISLIWAVFKISTSIRTSRR